MFWPLLNPKEKRSNLYHLINIIIDIGTSIIFLIHNSLHLYYFKINLGGWNTNLAYSPHLTTLEKNMPPHCGVASTILVPTQNSGAVCGKLYLILTKLTKSSTQFD